MEFLELVEASLKPIDEHFTNKEESCDDAMLVIYSNKGNIGFSLNGNGKNLVIDIATAIDKHNGFRNLVESAMEMYEMKKSSEREKHINAETAKHAKKINS